MRNIRGNLTWQNQLRVMLRHLTSGSHENLVLRIIVEILTTTKNVVYISNSRNCIKLRHKDLKTFPARPRLPETKGYESCSTVTPALPCTKAP